MPSDFMIIESLKIADEDNNRFEGKYLKKYLELCDLEPAYYYIRTKKELEFVSERMINAQKTLFISCHGGENNISTTLDKISFNDFAKIFHGKLNGKRVLGSFCFAGRKKFARALYNENPEMSCFIAPVEEVAFESTYPFWTAFFSILLSSEKRVNENMLTTTLSVCSHLFNMNMAYYPKKWGDGTMKEPKLFDSGTIGDEDCEMYRNIVKIVNKIQ